MPPHLLRTLLAVPLLLGLLSASAQMRPGQDVLYLKNGSVVRGSIIRQQPGEWVRILMVGGSVLVVRQQDIERITVEVSPYDRIKVRYNRRRLRQRI